MRTENIWFCFRLSYSFLYQILINWHLIVVLHCSFCYLTLCNWCCRANTYPAFEKAKTVSARQTTSLSNCFIWDLCLRVNRFHISCNRIFWCGNSHDCPLPISSGGGFGSSNLGKAKSTMETLVFHDFDPRWTIFLDSQWRAKLKPLWLSYKHSRFILLYRNHTYGFRNFVWSWCHYV